MIEQPISFNTSRLRLLSLSADNAVSLQKLIFQNKDYLQISFPVTVESARNVVTTQLFIEKLLKETQHSQAVHFCIWKDLELIGYIGLKKIEWRLSEAELAYYMDEKHQNKGYTKEVLDKIVSYSFQTLNLNLLVINTISDNIPSIRVAEKCGFIKSPGAQTPYVDGFGKFCTLHTYLVNKEKWLDSN